MVLNEESLTDSLVDYNESDLWFVLSTVVTCIDCILELHNFTPDHLVFHRLTHSISVDDKVGRVVAVVTLSICFDGSQDRLSHVTLHKFLVLLLDDVL